VKTSMNLLRGIPWLAKELVVYQEKFCCKQLAGWLFSTSPFTMKSFRIFCYKLHLIFKNFAVATASRNMASGVRDVSLEMTMLFVATRVLSANFVPFATRSSISQNITSTFVLYPLSFPIHCSK